MDNLEQAVERRVESTDSILAQLLGNRLPDFNSIRLAFEYRPANQRETIEYKLTIFPNSDDGSITLSSHGPEKDIGLYSYVTRAARACFGDFTETLETPFRAPGQARGDPASYRFDFNSGPLTQTDIGRFIQAVNLLARQVDQNNLRITFGYLQR